MTSAEDPWTDRSEADRTFEPAEGALVADDGGGDGVERREMLRAASALPIGIVGTELLDDDFSPVGDLIDDLEEIPVVPQIDGFEGWQAGDLHVHTHHSHDVCETPACEEPWTYGYDVAEQIRNAERRGLDYLAITDHDTVAAQDDPGYGSDELTLLPGYEHSLEDGHAGFLGADRYYDRPSANEGQLRSLVDELRRDGGLAVINHPRTEISSTWGYDSPAGMDAVEVWSIAWFLRDETVPPLASNNHEGLSMYDDYLDAGHRLAAVGGSDSHWRATNALQGPGQPTTWVYAPDGDGPSILEAIRRGRTAVSWDWTGPMVDLEARGTTNEYEHRVGDVVRASGPIDLRVRVGNGLGHRVRIVVDGEVADETVVTATPYEWEPTVDVADDPADAKGHNWIRAEVLLEESLTMRALTSPLYATHGGRPDREGDCSCHAPAVRRAYHDRSFDHGGRS